jgi:DNA repair exonuclease SbcCD nuclease subunit
MPPLSFLHTADLQIGMTAPGVGPLAKRIQDARVESLRIVFAKATDLRVNFIVIAGDMFETNQVSKRYVQQVIRLLEDAGPLPIFILPGNHDHFGSNSVYRLEEFTRLGAHIHILTERKPFVLPEFDATLYPSPCFETRSNESPATWIKKQPGTRYHIAILHGSIPSVFGHTTEEDEFYPMTVDELRKLGMDYIALGHWHSLYPDPAKGGESPFFYSGTPEPTGFGERKSGYAVSVELSEGGRNVAAISTAQYEFVDLSKEIKDAPDVEALKTTLLGLPQPDKTLVRVALHGVTSIATKELLEEIITDAQSRLANIRVDDKELLLEPDESDLSRFTRGGIASTTFALLRKKRDVAQVADRQKLNRAISLAYKAFKGGLE